MSNPHNGSYHYKIGLVGPSRVGKTTLITSILDDSQSLLEKTLVSLSPKDGATRKRINENRNYLSGAIKAKHFNPGALAGTEEAFTYDLEMNVERQNMISFSFMDYPGGWLANNPEKWRQSCDSWLEESTVLLVPIDATVIMEANTGIRKAAVPHILHIADVQEVVREWAKARKRRPSERSVLMLVPLKCETYFSDNGGTRKHEEILLKEVKDWYGDIIKIPVNEEIPNNKIYYCPVDTYGCVEVKKPNWAKKDNIPGGQEFSAEFRFRSTNPQIQRKAAGDVLLLLCKHLMGIAYYQTQEVVNDMQSDLKDIVRELDLNRAEEDAKWFWTKAYEWVTGHNKTKKAIESGESKKTDLLKMISSNDQKAKILLDGISTMLKEKDLERAEILAI